jgi:hypothetical protein
MGAMGEVSEIASRERAAPRAARLALGAGVLLAALCNAPPASADNDVVIDPTAWRVIKSESGPVDYYSVQSDGVNRFVHSHYVPPMKTTVLGYQVADGDRRRVRKVRWSWRAITLPNGGDECSSRSADSAAVVYVSWKRGLRYYTLKYVWSAVSRKGAVCDSRRNPFVAQDTVIVESGGPTGVWKNVEIDLAEHFRHHFAHDDPTASVPDFVGLGIMSDGDQTNSESSADVGTFTLVR